MFYDQRFELSIMRHNIGSQPIEIETLVTLNK